MKNPEKYKKERKEVALFIRRLYRQGLTTTSGGKSTIEAAERN